MTRHSRPRRYWTAEEDDVLRRLFADTPTHAIATQLGRHIGGVFQRAYKLGLAKSDAYLASPLSGRTTPGSQRGATTRFKPGSVPANKGVRHPKGWAPGRMAATQFPAGQVPHNTVPIGTETLRRDGYVWVKRSEGLKPARRNWVSKHQAIYEAAHGPIPTGHIVRFFDNDRTNFALDNLECVSRKHHVITRGLHALPPELVQIHQLRGAVIRRINRRQPPEPARRGRPPKAARSAA
jgi:hypothetical protein